MPAGVESVRDRKSSVVHTMLQFPESCKQVLKAENVESFSDSPGLWIKIVSLEFLISLSVAGGLLQQKIRAVNIRYLYFNMGYKRYTFLQNCFHVFYLT